MERERIAAKKSCLVAFGTCLHLGDCPLPFRSLLGPKEMFNDRKLDRKYEHFVVTA